jgi:hypothetical protein
MILVYLDGSLGLMMRVRYVGDIDDFARMK